jgi:cysteine desulfurase
MGPVYLDYNATTPLDPRVRDAMLAWMGPLYGNPSSRHGFGQQAREAVEGARAQVATLIGARPADVVFTASGSEADNAVIASATGLHPGLGSERMGVGPKGRGGRLVLSALEHPAVAATAARLAASGRDVVTVPPGPDGRVAAGAMLAAAGEEASLVCLMLANNEIGTLQPVAEVAAACRERGVPVLCDAVQAAGKIPLSVQELGVDFLVLGAHKFYGPLGAAALWIRPGAPFDPLILGGGQERRRRAGTENVAALVGFGVAAELAARELGERSEHLRKLRDRFELGLDALPDVVVHGRSAPRLPNTSHVACLGVQAEALSIRLDLDGFAVSTGSACHSGVVEPSEALIAMGLSREEALSSMRVSFGVTSQAAEVDAFLACLAFHLGELRAAAAAEAAGAVAL